MKGYISTENQHNEVLTNSVEREEMDYISKWCSENRHDINWILLLIPIWHCPILDNKTAERKCKRPWIKGLHSANSPMESSKCSLLEEEPEVIIFQQSNMMDV